MGGMVFNAGSKVVSQGFFALNNTWLSMINACVYLMINATLSSILAPRLGIVGLGISNSTAGLVDFSLNIILLLWLWRRSDDSSAAHHEAPIPWRRLWPIYVLVPILIASGVSLQSVWHGQLTSVDIVAHLPVMMSATLALTVAGGIVGLVWLWVTTKWGPEDLRLTISKLFNKVRRQFIRQ